MEMKANMSRSFTSGRRKLICMACAFLILNDICPSQLRFYNNCFQRQINKSNQSIIIKLYSY